MLIAKIENGAITVGDYRELFPSTSFPPSGPSTDFLVDMGCKQVNLFKPHDQNTEKLVACNPYEEGEWVYTVRVEAKTADEIAADIASLAAQVRAQRDQLLSATDWRFRSDLNPSQEWKDYCQALRDVPSQAGFPKTIVWPKAPNAPETIFGA